MYGSKDTSTHFQQIEMQDDNRSDPFSVICDNSLEQDIYRQRTLNSNSPSDINKTWNNCSAGYGKLNLPTLFVEGPYGSSMENIRTHKIAVCIAGGIGVTPFIAVINDIT